AEDGIRDGHVTGVQTCALPISRTCGERVGVRGCLNEYRMRGESPSPELLRNSTSPRKRGEVSKRHAENPGHFIGHLSWKLSWLRSEERRVGKGCRAAQMVGERR